jgi:hypothetical protein
MSSGKFDESAICLFGSFKPGVKNMPAGFGCIGKWRQDFTGKTWVIGRETCLSTKSARISRVSAMHSAS